MRRRWLIVALPLAVLVAALLSSSVEAGPPPPEEPTAIARGPHISGVVRYAPQAAAAPLAPPSTCSTPGPTNYITNCNGTGRPANETWIATNGSSFVAGANDYNSYNGQGQNGFYWSADGTNWNDAGPIDLFPHSTNNGSGDAGLANDASGRVN
jgi:hypothetical protein